MSRAQLGVDADRIWADVMALAAITDPDQPYTRRSFTPRFLEGRAWLARRFEEAGLSVRIDAAGNLIGRREGRNPGAPAITVGSHSDTVPSGGRFDGIAGVAAGLEIARALARHRTRAPAGGDRFPRRGAERLWALLRRQPRHVGRADGRDA